MGVGSLEVLEHLMRKTSPIMKLHNSLVMKKLSIGNNLQTINGELKLLRCKNGTEKQVKSLMHLKKKTTKELESLAYRLSGVKKEYDGNMTFLKDLYERVERTTTQLFEDTTYRGLVHWAKLHERGADLKVNENTTTFPDSKLAANSEGITLSERTEGELRARDEEYHQLHDTFRAANVGIMGQVVGGRKQRGGNHGLLQQRPGTTPGNFVGGMEGKGNVDNHFERLMLRTPSNHFKREEVTRFDGVGDRLTKEAKK